VLRGYLLSEGVEVETVRSGDESSPPRCGAAPMTT
jgi:hypothetical protein